MKSFLIGLWHATKSGYNWQWPAHWLDQEEAPKYFQSQTCTKKKKKVIITLWWSAAGLIHYSFLSPGKIIISEKQAQQINEMHRKLQSMQLALVNRKDTILPYYNAQPQVTQPMLQKSKKLGYRVLPHLPNSPDLSPTTSSSISTIFCRENISTTSRRQKMLPKSSLNPKTWIFMLQE